MFFKQKMQSLKKMIKLVPLGNTMGVEHIPYSPNAVRAFMMEIIVGIEMLAHSLVVQQTHAPLRAAALTLTRHGCIVVHRGMNLKLCVSVM